MDEFNSAELPSKWEDCDTLPEGWQRDQHGRLRGLHRGYMIWISPGWHNIQNYGYEIWCEELTIQDFFSPRNHQLAIEYAQSLVESKLCQK